MSSSVADTLNARRDRVSRRPTQTPPPRKPADGEPAIASVAPPPARQLRAAEDIPSPQPHVDEPPSPPPDQPAPRPVAVVGVQRTVNVRVAADLEEVASQRLGELRAHHRLLSSKRELVELFLWELRDRGADAVAEQLHRFRAERGTPGT